jgi:hypothetical protein
MNTHCECGICGHFNEKDCIEKWLFYVYLFV